MAATCDPARSTSPGPRAASRRWSAASTSATGNGVVSSICRNDYADALQQVVERIQSRLRAAASPRPPDRARALRARRPARELVGEGFKLLTLVLGWVVDLVPLAIFGVLAKIVGTTGFGLFASLGKLVATVAFGLFVHVAVWYTLLLVLVARRNPLTFYRAAAPAMLTALSTGSSMATLPVTLDTLEKKLGVSPASARLAACIGTNFNNDGIMLYEVVAALFVAQLAGIHLSAGQTAAMAATSALAAAGIAGVPEAGLITLSLVLHASNLPLTALPVLLSVDWLLGRLRATTNVASDLTIATVLDRWREPEAPPASAPGVASAPS
jgi:Na+/H+-dicarboxylate symporter